MLPDAAKGTQDAIRIVANPSEMFTDSPKMVSAPNVRSLFIHGGPGGGAEPPQDSIFYECKIDMQMRNKKSL